MYDFSLAAETEEDLFKKFKLNNKVLFEQSIVLSFFSEKANKDLLKKALGTSETNYSIELDNEFRKHYQKARIVKYVSNLSHFYSIDFDKKERKYRQRYLSILSQPLSKEQSDVGNTFTDLLIQDKSEVIEAVLKPNNVPLEEQLQDEIIYKAMKRLNSKQKEVLNLIYNHQLKLKEIAKLKRKSPQSISQLHKFALKKIKEEVAALKNERR